MCRLAKSKVKKDHILIKIKLMISKSKLNLYLIMLYPSVNFEWNWCIPSKVILLSKLWRADFDINHYMIPMSAKLCRRQNKYSWLSLTQLCITQYYRLSRLDGPVSVFSPIYYCNSTTFISTTAKSIKLLTRYEKLVSLINFSVFYNA